MEPTPVRVSLMESRRPGLVVTLPALHLGVLQRLGRTLKRLLVVTGCSLLALNVTILALPFPTVHLCTVPVALILGPLAAVFTWQARALLGGGAVPCPHCSASVAVPEQLPGWPARMNCQACGVRVELTPALAAPVRR